MTHYCKLASTFLVGTILFACACDSPTITVSNREELYDAVNNPANKGAHILLKPGIYILYNHNGLGRFVKNNFGRLDLQPDMELCGSSHIDENTNKIVYESVIDGSGLPAEAFDVSTEPNGNRKTGCIRMGIGYTILKYLVLKGNQMLDKNGNPAALSIVDTDLPTPRRYLTATITSYVRIDHTILSGGQTGIDLRNGGTRAAHRVLYAKLYDNELNSFVAGAGQGITAQNSNGASNSEIKLDAQRNFSHHNHTGIRVMNTLVQHSTITINSKYDRFKDNDHNGILLLGGYSGAVDSPVILTEHNTIYYHSYNTEVTYLTTAASLDNESGAIHAAGGVSTVVENGANDNNVYVNLYDPAIALIPGPAITAYGANSKTTRLAGKNNNVILRINNWKFTTPPYTILVESNPTEPAPATNHARTIP